MNESELSAVKSKLDAALIKMGTTFLKPQYRKRWTPDRPTTGYCYIVSEVVHHCLLARSSKPHVLRLKSGETHWFLKLPDGRVLDWTANQFSKPPPYDKARPINFLTQNLSKRGVKLANMLALPIPEPIRSERKRARSVIDDKNFNRLGSSEKSLP